jgi:hypothetical protein
MSRTKSYGYIRGPRNLFWAPVAASLKVHPKGGFWVARDSSGNITLALDATATLYGWGHFPRSLEAGSTAASNGYWTSNSSAGVSRVLVDIGIGTVFSMPVVSGDVYAEARNGETCDITGVASADGSPQEANLSASSTVVLVVEGGDLDNTSLIYTSINPAKRQVDSAGG